jgi:hypothetical protein
VELSPHLPSTVHPIVLFMNPPDHLGQCSVPAGTSRTPIRFALSAFVLVIGGRGDRQLLTDRLDPIRVAVLVHERGHLLGRRSSSAWAKYADAFRKISFARRNSRFSRRSALSSST